MATSSTTLVVVLPLLLMPLVLQVCHGSSDGCFSGIFAFGDSLQDTGNLVEIYPGIAEGKLPWGMTFFQEATGRFSDGRLIIDFIARALGLPLVAPYMGGGGDFSRGANFAVGGATALDKEELTDLGVDVSWWIPYPLRVQLDLFHEMLRLHPSLRDNMGNSLIMMGEIGGNDYNRALFQNMPVDEMESKIVPAVIQKITRGMENLIQVGAKTFIVPGNLPVGCIPVWLRGYRSENPEDYDENGCIVWLNAFSQYHNDHLNSELNRLNRVYPNVTIAYADYYQSGMRMFSNQQQFGVTEPFAACCGENFTCNETSQVCGDPRTFASWEGFHPTEATYSAIFDGLSDGGPFAIPFLGKQC